MRAMPMDFFADMDDQPSTMAMDVDDVDPLEIFGEGIISMDSKLANADFYNVFEDDFADSYMN
ncbi:small acidic protein 1 [Quercus suber]|uniref:Small acidic protein 1 n=1 Tax=Quercus suber TaxID=58331 RepID=A0AAW0M881_QUESU